MIFLWLMQSVQAEVFIEADEDLVYKVVRDLESYPEFMPLVHEVRILSKNPEETRIEYEWVAQVPILGIKERSLQEVRYKHETKSAHFWQKEGRLSHLEGYRTIQSVPGGTMIRTQVYFKLGSPFQFSLGKGLIQSLFQQNTQATLDSIKKRCESLSSKETL
ncbi:MAG: hypothetical protein D6767_08410 [Candidatus Hydrogenedentota bacterium]|nr:MAG: hypothetical protein D6767_08410 [Candidatus Hydrogenedentota bacterium]